MSGWGPAPSENDDAADWLSEVADDPHIDSLQEAIEDVADADDATYFELPECNIAVVAAHLLSELLDPAVLQSSIDDINLAKLRKQFNKKSAEDQRSLTRKAVSALETILNDSEQSELLQIWEADNEESFTEWKSILGDIIERLRSSSSFT